MNTEKINHNHSDETRIALLEQSINNINDTLVRFEKRFDKIDEKFNRVDEKLETLNSKIDTNFMWLIGLIITSIILPIVLHSLKLI